jgi:hypothetical protein
MSVATKINNIRFRAQPCAKRDLSSIEIQPSNCQFSAECKSFVPALKAMFILSGPPATVPACACRQLSSASAFSRVDRGRFVKFRSRRTK